MAETQPRKFAFIIYLWGGLGHLPEKRKLAVTCFLRKFFVVSGM